MNYFLRKKVLCKNLHIDIIMTFFIVLLIGYSIFVTWSASGQNIITIWNKIIQVIVGIIVMVICAQISPRLYEVLAPYLYMFCILLLILVNIFGQISKGAQRWLDFGFVHLQPSEIAKIAVPLMLARYINRNNCMLFLKEIIISLLLIFIPTLLVVMQPDLGTALLIAISGLLILFLSGIHWKSIVLLTFLIGIFIPVFWMFFMHDYQKDRIMMLLNFNNDPLGAGYHIIQSKIAIGSGGLTGKGWLQGTQSKLEFLPERHTDFILAVLGEELGFIGVLSLLIIYFGIIGRGLIISIKSQNTFGRVITGSLILILFFYIFINMGMVTGILPVVGIPLPLMSYGGSALVILMAEFGIIMSINSHKKMLSKNL